MSINTGTENLIPRNIADQTVPLFLGFILDSFLFGIICVQAYIYYLIFPSDNIRQKALVALLFVMEAFQTIGSLVDGFRWFGGDYGNMNEFDQIRLLWFTCILWGAQIALVTQCIYAWRIWVLSRKVWIPIVITVLAFFQAGLGTWSGLILFQAKRWSALGQEMMLTTTLWLGGTSATDILIAVTMITLLLRSRTGLKSTDVLVFRLVAYMVETGTMTAAVALLSLALVHKFPRTTYHMPACFAQSKAYTISFLAVLNSRTFFQRKNPINDLEVVGGTINGITIDTIRFNSAPSTGMHLRSTAHDTLSHRSKACHCVCESHINSVDATTLHLNDSDDPVHLFEVPTVKEESGSETTVNR